MTAVVPGSPGPNFNMTVPPSPTTLAAPASPIPHVTGPYLLFAVDVLRKGGFPVTPQNIFNLMGWFAAESGGGSSSNTGAFNPTNICHTVPASLLARYGGAPDVGKVGGSCSRSFPSWEAGTGALAASLHEPFSSPIAAALASSADANTFAAAVGRSGWGTGAGWAGDIRNAQANPSQWAGHAIIGGTPPAGAGAGIQLAGFDPTNPSTWPGVGSALGGISSVGDFITALGRGVAWLANPHNWARIIIGGMGIGAIFVGLFMIMRDIGPDAAQGTLGRIEGLAKDAAVGVALT